MDHGDGDFSNRMHSNRMHAPSQEPYEEGLSLSATTRYMNPCPIQTPCVPALFFSLKERIESSLYLCVIYPLGANRPGTSLL